VESADVGRCSGAEASGLSGGTFTQISGGDDIAASDAFRFTYQPLSGDGTIIARVSVMENTASIAKVGIMIREVTGD
jgi:hypothetical protein